MRHPVLRVALVAALIFIACSPGVDSVITPPPPPSSPPPPPPTKPIVTLTPNPTSIETGSATEVTVDVRTLYADSGCARSTGAPIVGNSFTVTVTQTVTDSVMCTGAGGTTVAAVTIVGVDPPTMPIHVFGVSPTGTPDMSGLHAVYWSGSAKDSINLANGSAFPKAPLSMRNQFGDTVCAKIDATDPNNRKYLPSIGCVLTNTVYTTGFTFTLVPISWTIPGCMYAGTTVPISVVSTQVPAGDGLNFYIFLTGRIPQGSMPAAFDRSSSNVPISAADSVAFWAGQDSVKVRFCTEFYHPAEMGEVVALRNGLQIAVDTTLTFADRVGSGGSDNYLQSANINFISIQAMTSSGLIQHATIHSIGPFGHTCSRPTVMFNLCEAFTPFPNRGNATAEDVAYVQVYFAVRKVQIAQNTQFGMDAALLGEQTVKP